MAIETTSNAPAAAKSEDTRTSIRFSPAECTSAKMEKTIVVEVLRPGAASEIIARLCSSHKNSFTHMNEKAASEAGIHSPASWHRVRSSS